MPQFWLLVQVFTHRVPPPPTQRTWTRRAHESLGGEVSSLVPPGDDLPVGRDDARRRQLSIPLVLVLARANDPVVERVCADDLAKLVEAEVVDVLLRAKHARTHEPLALSPQRLLVEKVAADDVVLRIFAVTGEAPKTTDHPLRFGDLLLSVWQSPQT